MGELITLGIIGALVGAMIAFYKKMSIVGGALFGFILGPVLCWLMLIVLCYLFLTTERVIKNTQIKKKVD